jgi:hypothetical protein
MRGQQERSGSLFSWGIEKVFGWLKAFGGLRQFKVRGRRTSVPYLACT